MALTTLPHLTSSRTESPPAKEVTRIRPPKAYVPVDLPELWRYRELLWQLAWRDVRVRYKQTALGASWAILQPVMPMIAFTIFFGRLGGFDQKVPGGIPYPVYSLCALIPWQLFSTAITQSGGSVVANRGLLTKIYFPRLIIPMVPLASGLIDFVIGLTLLLGMMLWYGIVPRLAIVFLPFFVLMAIAAALSVGLWLSSLNALYRDVQYTLGFLTQFWLLATPIAYPTSIVPPEWRSIYSLNPMVGVVDGFRWVLLNGEAPRIAELAVSCSVVVLLLTGGMFFFRRMESTFADRV